MSPTPAPAGAPEASRPPPTAEQYARWLEDASEALRAAGVSRTPSTRARGKLIAPALVEAYAEGRAHAYKGDPRAVLEWFTLAKFGVLEPGASRVEGPLARYELHLVSWDESRSYLHVVVPRGGPRSGAAHHGWVGEERFDCLCDRLDPGEDYLVFKTNGQGSVHRQWGRAWVIDELARLVPAYRERTGERLGVGDISLALGGKISDHWTHRRGVDVDFYLLYTGEDGLEHRWHHQTKQGSRWTAYEEPRGTPEAPLVGDLAGDTASERLLRALASLALENDRIWFFVHDAVELLDPFDEEAQRARPGRRFLHANNRAYWPAHRDHVHVRFTARARLPVGEPPRP